MSDPYRIALAVVRLWVAVDLASSFFLILVWIAMLAATIYTGDPALMYALLAVGTYVILYLTSAVAMWVFARPIARFAARAFSGT